MILMLRRRHNAFVTAGVLKDFDHCCSPQRDIAFVLANGVSSHPNVHSSWQTAGTQYVTRRLDRLSYIRNELPTPLQGIPVLPQKPVQCATFLGSWGWRFAN